MGTPTQENGFLRLASPLGAKIIDPEPLVTYET